MTALADKLTAIEEIVGPANLLTATDAVSRYRVDGQQPLAVALPATPDEVAAVLRFASQNGLSVLPRGAGRHLHLGAVPGPIGIVLSLARLNRVVDYDYENLTITVEAGATLAAIQQEAASRRQFLPLDPAGGDVATLGGVAAANLSGPLRNRYGAPRDLVIGVRAALSDGARIRAGGKTVKNVAGYELAKLLVGSFGTLAVLTEVTARLAPFPEAVALLAIPLPLEPIRTISLELLSSRLEIAFLAVCDPLSLRRARLHPILRATQETYWLLVGLAGDKCAVERQQRELRSLAANCTMLDGDDATSAWRGLREAPYPAAEGDTIARVGLPLSETVVVLQAVARWDGWWSLASLDQGIVRVGARQDENTEEAVRKLSELRGLAEARGGFLVVEAAPPQLKRAFPVWGEVANLDLMRRLKESYDPTGTLGCGRNPPGL